MPMLYFPERETLRQALASGGVPASVTRAPADARVDFQGRLWLNTSVSISRETLVALKRIGIQVTQPAGPIKGEPISCWHELLPLLPDTTQPRGKVLFDLPGERFASFVGEIERLGTHPCLFCWLDSGSRVWIQTTDPPVSTLLRAESTDRSICVYHEHAAGVWIASGWRHPMVDQIAPPRGKWLFLGPPREWQFRDDQPFQASVASYSLSRPVAPQPEVDGSPSGPVAEQSNSDCSATGLLALNVRLRLVEETTDALPELWLIDRDARHWLETFVQSVDEDRLRRFSFAFASNDDGPFVMLRVVARRRRPPVIVGLPSGYQPLLKIPNLFIPCGQRIAPLPRRDALRRILAVEPNRLAWLKPLGNGGFRLESLPLTAFRPLGEWIEYRCDQPGTSSIPWTQIDLLRFEPFIEKRDGLPRRLPTTERPGTRNARKQKEAENVELPVRQSWLSWALSWLSREKKKVEEPAAPSVEISGPIPVEEAVQTALRRPRESGLETSSKTNPIEDRLVGLKSRFLDSITKLTPEDRLELWPELAAEFAKLNNHPESGICWLNALWEQDKLSPLWAWGWFRAEATQAGWRPHEARIGNWLAAPPTKERVRTVAAYVVWSSCQTTPPPDFLANLNGIQAYLDQHDSQHWLPTRADWLARSAIVRWSHGDVLTLARTRDRILARLMNEGLSLDLDAPAFIRFRESEDSDRFDHVRKWLIAKRKLIQKWIAQLAPEKLAGQTNLPSLAPMGLEAEVRCTGAYADLMLSWALSRLGEKSESAHLREYAGEILDDADPVHAFLKSAFDSRIRQMREGKRADGSLAPELLARLERLPADTRYAIDRLRRHSRILDPTERIDPYWAWAMRGFAGWTRIKKQLVTLPGLTSESLHERIRQLLNHALGEGISHSPIILHDILDLVPRLDSSLGAKVIAAIPNALDQPTAAALRMPLLEKGMLLAGYFDRASLAQPLIQRFLDEIQNGLPDKAVLAGLTGQTFRTLRRLGMKNEAYETLGRIHTLLTRGEDISELRKAQPGDWPSLMRTLLYVAAGYYYAGPALHEQGHRILDEVRRDLFDGVMSPADRTALAITYASALGQVPVRSAEGRFEELFQRLKNISVSGQNTHYTLQPLELIDTVLQAIVSEDFAIGPTIRGWLDDDEYLVRQRINRELQELMKQQGV
ncbi:MAG: hypothetical protein K8T89_15695 [Planctomycetes bacterium]|nr:hypothetical protein [Planctomycetota bacterium]